ncbi:MAG TPA: tetratricopeptide repeat protein, partial [Terriglobales bacterium]
LATVSAAASPVEVLIAEGRADEAITSLQQRTQSSPNDAEAFNLLCRTYFALGDWNRGIPNCEKAAKLEANNARYHLWLGRIYGEKADAANFFSAASLAGKVRTEFETAVKLSPDNVEARTDLAEFYLEAPGIVGGGRDKAEAEARVLDKLDPGKAHWVRARMAQKAKDSATAEKEYRAAIEASKGSANAWLNLALFYRRIGRLSEMEDALNHAVAARSNEPQVLPEAAETLIRAERNFPTAIEWLRRYLASNSKVEEVPAFKAHYLLGTVLEKQGDKKAAAQEYSAALSLAKHYSRARQALERVNR